ncbi:MAG TPA: YidC/Oxa1 family membrane protein insertase [Rubrobacter sp.]|nr:YidC/Oxa1 family membrane protein insertase [Rubrobacter sp.]
MLDFLRNLLDPLFNLMGGTLSTFHGWGAPWWLAIVMLTIIVRGLLFPITYRQVKSMRRMQELKPEMDEVRSRYKDDVPKQREEMTKLYQERNVNPLGGCLPVVIQLPIFLVLYYTIRHFDKLESFRTGGLFWFKDLTQPDHLFILPVLYVLTMMASQEITIRNTAPQQAQLMRFLPIIFGFFLARFPSGLFVYWVTSNLITFTQNYVIYNILPHKTAGTDEEKPIAESGEKAPPTEKKENGKVPQKSGRARNRKKKKVGKRR